MSYLWFSSFSHSRRSEWYDLRQSRLFVWVLPAPSSFFSLLYAQHLLFLIRMESKYLQRLLWELLDVILLFSSNCPQPYYIWAYLFLIKQLPVHPNKNSLISTKTFSSGVLLRLVAEMINIPAKCSMGCHTRLRLSYYWNVLFEHPPDWWIALSLLDF